MAVSCGYWIGDVKFGLKVEHYVVGREGTADQLRVRDQNGDVQFIYVCAEHATQLLRQATGGSLPTC
jgi:hypothetical protein